MSDNAEVEKEVHPEVKKIVYKPRQWILAALGILGMILIMALTPHDIGLETEGIQAMAILWLMVMWWVSDMFKMAVPALVGIALFLVFKVQPSSVVFSGYANSTVLFMVFAFVIATGVTKTGLGKRIAYTVMAKSPPNFKALLIIFALLSVALGALIPSGNARTVLLGTIGLMVLPVFGQNENKLSNIGRNLFVTLGLTSYMGSNGFLTGVAAIILTVGLLQQASIPVTYFQWMIATLPFCLIVAFLIALFVPRVFKPEVAKLDGEAYKDFKSKMESLGPMSMEEKKLSIVVVLVVLLWIIGDRLDLDYVTVGVAGGVILMLPLMNIVTTKDFASKITWDVIYFCGSCLTLGTVIVNTGVADFLANLINPLMGSPSLLIFCLKIWLVATLIHFILPAAVSAFGTALPIVIASSQVQGFSPIIPVVVFVLCYTGIVLVYEQPQAAISYSFRQFNDSDIIKPGLFSITLWLIMTPVIVGYLSLLGY